MPPPCDKYSTNPILKLGQRIAIELLIRQPYAVHKELVGANVQSRREIHLATDGYHIVLINTIAAQAQSAR